MLIVIALLIYAVFIILIELDKVKFIKKQNILKNKKTIKD